MSKLLAVKIIQTYTQLMKMQSETESQSSSSLSITVRRFISFWTIPCSKLEIVAGLCSCPCFLRLFIKKIAGGVFTLSFVIPLPFNEWRRVFRSVAIFLFVFALFCFFIKSS